MSIQGFADPALERFFREGTVPRRVGWSAIARVARRKLDMLDYANVLSDLASPPGNRLEALKGDLVGYHSVRINDRWRAVFRWSEPGPEDVRIIDYHLG